MSAQLDHRLQGFALPIEEALASFIRNRRALDRSPQTLYEYRLACRALGDFLMTQFEWDDVSDIHRGTLEDFLIEYRQTHAPGTVNKTFRTLRSLFNWLEREDELVSNPFRRMSAPPAAYSPQEGYSQVEVKRIIKHLGERITKSKGSKRELITVRDLAIILTLFDTGLRAGEMIAMTVEGIDWNTGLFKVLGKGGKHYQRHIGETAMAAIDRYLRLRRRKLGESIGPLWVGNHGIPMTRSGLRRMCKEIGKAVGVADADTHRWRYTHSEALEELGWQEHEIMAEMGHTTRSISRSYREAAIRRGALKKHREKGPTDLLKSG